MLELMLSTVATVVTVLDPNRTTPIVDVTRAVSGTDITLQLTESLPTGRSYQSYLQLVPGVLPDNPNQAGNPSSRSGINWQDPNTNGNLGISSDNAYYFEGINMTDPVTGDLWGEPQYRDHPGTEGHCGRNSGGVHRRSRVDFYGDHEV